MITPAEAQPILSDFAAIRKITRSSRVYALLLHAETEVSALVVAVPVAMASGIGFRLFGLGGRVP